MCCVCVCVCKRGRGREREREKERERVREKGARWKQHVCRVSACHMSCHSYGYMYLYMYLFACMYIYICIHLCIHIYTNVSCRSYGRVMSLVWMSHVSFDKAIILARYIAPILPLYIAPILPLYIAPILTPYAPGSPRDDIAASWSKRLSACDVCRVSACRYQKCMMSEYIFGYIFTPYTTLPRAS